MFNLAGVLDHPRRTAGIRGLEVEIGWDDLVLEGQRHFDETGHR